jgi:hypothetical protein
MLVLADMRMAAAFTYWFDRAARDPGLCEHKETGSARISALDQLRPYHSHKRAS